MSKTAKL